MTIDSGQLSVYIFLVTIVMPPIFLAIGFYLGRKTREPMVIDTRGTVTNEPEIKSVPSPGALEPEPLDLALRGKKPRRVTL